MNTVVSVASLASTTTVAAPSMAAVVSRDQDAELIALGQQFETEYRRWEPLNRESNVLGAEAHTRAWVRAGVEPDEDLLPDDGDVFIKHLRDLERTTGFGEAENKLNDANHELTEIASKIARLPCHTMAGLRAKLLPALWSNGHLFDEPINDLDWDKHMMRVLLEAVMRMTATPTPIPVEFPEVVDITEEDMTIGEASNAKRRRESVLA